MGIVKSFKGSAEKKREIIIDLETTGLFVSEGHRIIEVGAVEHMDGKPTGKTFHALVNPERDIPAESTKVHQITNEMVKDKPCFKDIARELREFIGDATVVITCRTGTDGYTLDKAFMKAELEAAGEPIVPESQWLNVRRWAEEMFGEKARLDDMADRYQVSRAEREEKGHGALLDAQLLSAVYPSLLKDYMRFTQRHAGPDKKDQRTPPGA